MLSRRETRLFGLKFSLCTRSQLAWVPKGCREGAWGVTLLQGSGNNSQEALQEIFRAKVKGHCFSSQEASSLQACPSLHVCVGGAVPPPQGGCDSWQKDGQEIAGELCLLTRRAGASGFGLVLSTHGFPQKQPSWLRGCPSLCLSLPASLVEGTFLRQAISQPGA